MPGWPVLILGDTDAHFGFQARAGCWVFSSSFHHQGMFTCERGCCVLWEEGRDHQGVLRAEFLGMRGQGLCSPQAWEPVAHVEKKKLQEKSVCTGDLKSNRFNLQSSS